MLYIKKDLAERHPQSRAMTPPTLTRPRHMMHFTDGSTERHVSKICSYDPVDSQFSYNQDLVATPSGPSPHFQQRTATVGEM